MKVAIERAVLLKALGHVQSVVEKRGTIPILSNIRLEASNGSLELTATDMDVALVESIAANVLQSGATTLPAHTFYEIVRKLPEGAEITLEEKADDHKVIIKAGHSRFSLSTLPVDDFPAMAEGDLAHSFVLTGSECRALVEKTRFAMSTEETRYYLNGVYLHAAESNGTSVLRAVATDGHRLARLEVALPSGAAGMPGIIIPRKTIGELFKLIEEGSEEVKISLSDTKIRFVCGRATLVSKLIDGTFPDYDRVIPSGNDKILEVSTGAFSRAVDRVSVISADKARGIKLAVATGKLTFSASSTEHGTAQEELDVTYSSDPLEVGFNARYLLDMMSQIEGDTAQYIFSDSASPALVRDPVDVGALYVIMPMRV
ncbi:MAG: DNA polymerase III subunit beta [Rickettsiales bacterium]|nr:DNA polymerase III subunit beta [Rickettsiales bacterium]